MVTIILNLFFNHKSIIAAKVEKIRDVANLLPNIKKPHLEFVLLRSCIAIPKFMFTLRTTLTTDFPDLLQSFDFLVRETLEAEFPSFEIMQARPLDSAVHLSVCWLMYSR